MCSRPCTPSSRRHGSFHDSAMGSRYRFMRMLAPLGLGALKCSRSRVSPAQVHRPLCAAGREPWSQTISGSEGFPCLRSNGFSRKTTSEVRRARCCSE